MTSDKTVYRPTAGRSSPAIHRAEDCPNLDRARSHGSNIVERPADAFPDWVPRCPSCFDGVNADE